MKVDIMAGKPRRKPVQKVTEPQIDYSDLHVVTEKLANKLDVSLDILNHAASRLKNSHNTGFNPPDPALDDQEKEAIYLEWVAKSALQQYDLSASHLEAVIAYYELIWRNDHASYMLDDPFTFDHIREAIAANDKADLSRAFRRKLMD